MSLDVQYGRLGEASLPALSRNEWVSSLHIHKSVQVHHDAGEALFAVLI